MEAPIRRIVILIAYIGSGFSAAARGVAFDCHKNVIPERSLLITDLSIVNGPASHLQGPFSFETLLRRGLVNSDFAEEAVYDWLMQYKRVTSFNGYRLPDRRPKPLLDLWPFSSRSDEHRSGGTLDLGKAPFNLLGIAFRPDLSSTDSFGEARFIFGVVDRVGLPRDMTVIFEFSLRRSNLFPTKNAWFEALANLSATNESEEYLRQLKRIVEEATYPHAGHTRLAKLRTNEQFFGQGWDMREFVVDGNKQRFAINSVEKTPDFSLSVEKQSELVAWIKSNALDVMRNSYSLPKEFESGSAFFLDNLFRWFDDFPDMDEDLRHQFAENTCSGCHGAETGTDFFHVRPRRSNQPSNVSRYLTNKLRDRADLLKSEICD
jgi:hypothetical protein